MAIRAFVILMSVGSLHGAGILDAPVPWSGRISGSTLAELVARMRGWSEAGGSDTFRLSTRIPAKLSTRKLDLIRIPDAPRPTYRELLVAAFKDLGQKVELRGGGKGVEVIFIHARSIQLPAGAKQALTRKGRMTPDGIKSELEGKGWVLSEFAILRLSAENSSLLVQGTPDDVDKVARFFGQK